VRQADLSRAWIGPAPDHARVADGVMRGAKGPHGAERLARLKHPGNAVDLGGFERLLERHGRKNGGQAPGEHGLARTGRADQEDVVPAGRGDLQSPLGGRLAADLTEVHRIRRALGHERRHVGLDRRQGFGAGEMVADLLQRARTAHLEAGDYGRLGQIVLRHQDGGTTRRARREGHGEGTTDGAEVSLEPHLADHERVGEALAGDLAAGDQDAQGNGQVERRAILPDVGGGQVDGDPAEGEFVSGVGQGRADPFPTLFDRAMGQANGVEGGETAADVHFHVHGIRVDAEDGGGTNGRKHGFKVRRRGLAGRIRVTPRGEESCTIYAVRCGRRCLTLLGGSPSPSVGRQVPESSDDA
jgi:hypothetical protein